MTETHTHKNTPPWATSATVSYAVRGSPLPVPAGRACSPHRGRRWARSVYFFLPGGVSSVTFCTSARESGFFPNTCDVRRCLCCRPLLSVARLGTTYLLAILWATPGTCSSLKLALWGLLWATKCAPSEKRESDGAETIGGRCFFNQTTTNQKMEFVVGDYWGGRATAVDGVRGGVLACLGQRYRQRNK